MPPDHTPPNELESLSLLATVQDAPDCLGGGGGLRTLGASTPPQKGHEARSQVPRLYLEREVLCRQKDLLSRLVEGAVVWRRLECR